MKAKLIVFAVRVLPATVQVASALRKTPSAAEELCAKRVQVPGHRHQSQLPPERRTNWPMERRGSV